MPYMDISLTMIKFYMRNRYIYRIIIVLSFGWIGCTTPTRNINDDLSQMEYYKLHHEWIDMDNPSYPVTTMPKLGLSGIAYEDAVSKYGKPVYEFDDTVIHGNNIKTGVPDYDLYPLTLDRDTVCVHRAWWFLSYKTDTYLYLVFERSDTTTSAIYGYCY